MRSSGLRRFSRLRDPTGTFSRQRAIERLIDRDLILQQAKLQPQEPSHGRGGR